MGRFIPADVSSFSVLPRSAPPVHLQSPVKRSERGPPAYALCRCRGVAPTRCSHTTKLGCGTSPTERAPPLACGRGRADRARLPLEIRPLQNPHCRRPCARHRHNGCTGMYSTVHASERGALRGGATPLADPTGEGYHSDPQGSPWRGPRGARVTRDENWHSPRLFAMSRWSAPPERRRVERAG